MKSLLSKMFASRYLLPVSAGFNSLFAVSFLYVVFFTAAATPATGVLAVFFTFAALICAALSVFERNSSL